MKTKSLISLIALSAFVNAQNIYTFAGTGVAGFGGDGGAATSAKLNKPYRVDIDAFGNIYISDGGNGSIRKVTVSGVISTFAGTGVFGYSGDGGAATAAQMNFPAGIAFDALGNAYIADAGDNRVRKVSGAGIISTFAGTGVAGFSGDGGAATLAKLDSPCGIAIDASGNVYIADRDNHRIRMVNASGIISTFAGTGTGGFNGDGGPPTTKQLYLPYGVDVDASGNVFVADYMNFRIRKINVGGVVSTVAGTGSPGYSGDGGAATSALLYLPTGVDVDATGNIYILGEDIHRIRMVNNSGVITTIAGTGLPGFSGDGGLCSNAQLSNPYGVAVDASGNIYIADKDNDRVREICVSSCLVNIISLEEDKNSISAFPNPTNGKINLLLNHKVETLKLINALGQAVLQQENITQEKLILDISEQPVGLYFLEIQQKNNIKRVKVVKN